MSNQRTEESKLERIRKLLALSKNNPSVEEAKSALAKAQCLANKEGMTIDDIEFEGSHSEPGVVEEMVDSNDLSLSSWKARLAILVCKNFRTSAIKTHSWGRSGLKIVGFPQDVAITKEVFHYIVSSFEYNWKIYWRDYKKEFGTPSDRSWGIRIRNTYFEGFIEGLELSFSKNVEEHGLIVVTPDAVIERVKEISTGKGATVQAGATVDDMVSYMVGKKDGEATGDNRGKKALTD